MKNNIEFTHESGAKIVITGNVEKITDEVIKELQVKKFDIYWSDSAEKHYIFTFKKCGIWFDSMEINNELTFIELYAN